MALGINYNPDILSCLANLSSDEVFTPPDIANAVLDLVPESFWSDPEVKVLDPACKSGVFLREAAKRFISGLEKQIPDLQERVDHIFHKQLYGFAITELTGHMSRRSLYCSKNAKGDYSVSKFDNPSGNIFYHNIEHTWSSDSDDAKCVYCGVSRSEYQRACDLEQHAYGFIHLTEKEIKELQKMHFDLIISNPPYQLNDGGFGISASPIYNKFIEMGKRLQPRFMSMIVPARWFSGGKGLDEFRQNMLNDDRLRIIHDYPNADDCFNGVQIKGGVCYFLWDRDHKGLCKVYTHRGGDVSEPAERSLLEEGSDTFIRYNEGVKIYRKVRAFKEKTMESLVSSRKPFGLDTTFHGRSKKEPGDVKIYENQGISYAARTEIPIKDYLEDYKVFIPRSSSGSDAFPHPILGKPFVGLPNTACSETYIVVGPFSSVEECENVISYLQTKFMRSLALLKKVTQSTLRALYTFVPVQDFSHPWNDEMLYEKYGISEDEKAFIDAMITPMDGKSKEAIADEQ